MLELRVMLWNLGVILWGWGLVNSCLGVWPNSRICVSMAILWSGSSMLAKETESELHNIMLNIFHSNHLWVTSFDTCHSRCHLHRSAGGTLKDKEDNYESSSSFWCVWCWKQLVVVLPLWAATASLPLCLKPNTRSIHSWRCSDTYWLSRAVLCFWRKSLASADGTQETWSGAHWKHYTLCCQVDVGVGAKGGFRT